MKTEAENMIRHSSWEGRTIIATMTAELASELSIEAEGYVEPKDSEWEYWGTYNGNPWRIHLV